MRKFGRACIGIFTLLVLFGTPEESSGWGNTWMGFNMEQLINSLHRKVGPFKVDASFRLSNVGYDSNLYLGSLSGPVHDFTLRVGPDIRAYLPYKKRLVLEVREFPYYGFFLQTEKERAWNNIFQGRIHFIFKDLYILLGKGMTNLRERLNTEVFVNIRRMEDSYQGTLLWQASRGTSFSLQYGRNQFDYENYTLGTANIRENLNRTEERITFTGFFQSLARTRFALVGEYGQFNFIKTSDYKDSRSFSTLGGIEFLQGRGIQGRINLGYKVFDLVNPQGKDYRGIVGNMRLAVKLLHLTELAGFFERDIVFSIWSDNAYYVQTLYGAGLSHSPSRRIRLGYDFSYGTNSYPMTEPEPADTPQHRLDRLFIHSFTSDFRLSRDLSLGFIASLVTRNSNLQERDDQRNFFGINMNYKFE